MDWDDWIVLPVLVQAVFITAAITCQACSNQNILTISDLLRDSGHTNTVTFCINTITCVYVGKWREIPGIQHPTATRTKKESETGGKTPKILACKLLLHIFVNVTEVILNLFKDFCINWFYKNFQLFSSGKEVCMSFLEFKISMLWNTFARKLAELLSISPSHEAFSRTTKLLKQVVDVHM